MSNLSRYMYNQTNDVSNNFLLFLADTKFCDVINYYVWQFEMFHGIEPRIEIFTTALNWNIDIKKYSSVSTCDSQRKNIKTEKTRIQKSEAEFFLHHNLKSTLLFSQSNRSLVEKFRLGPIYYDCVFPFRTRFLINLIEQAAK